MVRVSIVFLAWNSHLYFVISRFLTRVASHALASSRPGVIPESGRCPGVTPFVLGAFIFHPQTPPHPYMIVHTYISFALDSDPIFHFDKSLSSNSTKENCHCFLSFYQIKFPMTRSDPGLTI